MRVGDSQGINWPLPSDSPLAKYIADQLEQLKGLPKELFDRRVAQLLASQELTALNNINPEARGMVIRITSEIKEHNDLSERIASTQDTLSKLDPSDPLYADYKSQLHSFKDRLSGVDSLLGTDINTIRAIS